MNIVAATAQNNRLAKQGKSGFVEMDQNQYKAALANELKHLHTIQALGHKAILDMVMKPESLDTLIKQWYDANCAAEQGKFESVTFDLRADGQSPNSKPIAQITLHEHHDELFLRVAEGYIVYPDVSIQAHRRGWVQRNTPGVMEAKCQSTQEQAA